MNDKSIPSNPLIRTVQNLRAHYLISVTKYMLLLYGMALQLRVHQYR